MLGCTRRAAAWRVGQEQRYLAAAAGMRWDSVPERFQPGEEHQLSKVLRRWLSTSVRPSKISKLQLRQAAEQKKRLREAEQRRGQQVIGGVMALCGASCIAFAHPEAALGVLRNPDAVGSALVAAGAATAIAPSIVATCRGAIGLREQLKLLHIQLASTRRTVEELLREVRPTEDEETPKTHVPSKVLHLRNVPPDATLDDIDDLFPENVQPAKIVLLTNKHQALVQLDSVAVATKALEGFDDVKPHIGANRIFPAFSIWPYLTAPKEELSSSQHAARRMRAAP